MLTRARAAVLVVAGLTLAACGSTHPGAAAVVDDQTISMKSLDKAAQAYCTLTLASAEQQGATPPASAGETRRQTLTTLVSLVVARNLADEQGVSVKSSQFEVGADERDNIAKAFPREDADEIAKLVETGRELSALSIALGEKATGQTATPQNEAQIGAAGQDEISKAFKDNDVEFAPRFGLSNSTAETIASTGSLSVAPADLGEGETSLPASQRCT